MGMRDDSSHNKHDGSSRVSDKQDEEEEEYGTNLEDLNLSNLSKLVLPPLGASSYTNNTHSSAELRRHSKGRRIISPMNSKYRSHTITPNFKMHEHTFLNIHV